MDDQTEDVPCIKSGLTDSNENIFKCEKQYFVTMQN